MKENFKKQFAILCLLLLMAIIVFTSILLLVLNMHWSIKVISSVLCIVSTFFIFVLIKKINKKLVYVERENVKVEETKAVEIHKKKILCPKCFNQYNGVTCFICGFNRDENKA